MLPGITSIVSALFALLCHAEDTFRMLILCGSGTCKARAAYGTNVRWTSHLVSVMCLKIGEKDWTDSFIHFADFVDL